MRLPESGLEVVASLLGATFTYYFIVAIYNITFHPLAKFPGPTLWAAFYFPQKLGLFRGTNDATVKLHHDRYGEVVRVSPSSLSFTSAQAGIDINRRKKGKSDWEQDPETFFAFPGSTPNMLGADNANHNRARRVLSHGFSDAALREQEQIIQSYCDLLITRLRDQVGAGTVDIVKYLNFCTFDILGDLAFGQSFQALESGKEHYFFATILGAIKVSATLLLFSTYPLTRVILNALLKYIPALGKPKKQLDNYTKEKVLRRMESKTDRKDYMTHILRHNNERGMSFEEICANSVILIMAGSETTATLMSGLLFLLLKNPKMLDRLTEEIRGAFTDRSEMTFAAEAKLPYLQACIDEGLRIYPPVPMSIPRITPPEGGVISGYFVPGNMSVGLHTLSAAHSKLNFADSASFVPDRWLPNADERYKNDDLSASQPFSLGQRSCLGKAIAYAEMRSIMVRILWYFDLKLVDKTQDWMDQRTFVVWDKPPLNVELSPINL